jgi:putative addiction module killer protein
MARQKVRIRLDRVRLGNLGRNRPVGAGVHELKIEIERSTLILLVSGGDKSTQRKDIALARSNWRDHQGRRSNG